MKISAVISSRMRLFILAAAALAAVILAGCATARQVGSHETQPQAAAPAPVDAPAEFVGQKGEKRQGMASWYGREFHGKPTASGEPYNMFAMTCAHRDYPLGTRLHVVHLVNNQDVECIVNDRGPFVANRDLDLSYAAAKKIGIIGPGVSRVSMQPLGRLMRYVKTVEIGKVAGAGSVTIQVGSFRDERNAQRLKKGLEYRYKGTYITQATIGNTKYHRVRIGKFKSADEASGTGKLLADEGYSVMITRY